MRFASAESVTAVLILACARPAAADGAVSMLDVLVRPHAESGIALSLGSSLPERDLVATDATVKVGIQILPLLPLVGVTSRTHSLRPRLEGELRLYPAFQHRDGFQPYFSAGFETGPIDVRSTSPGGRSFTESVRSNSWKLGLGLEYRFEKGLAFGGALGPYVAFWGSSRTASAETSLGVTTSLYAAWVL